MPGLEEAETVWRYRISAPDKYEKFRVKELGKGVKITLGKVKHSERWEIQNYMLQKTEFPNRESACLTIEHGMNGGSDFSQLTWKFHMLILDYLPVLKSGFLYVCNHSMLRAKICSLPS
jgi:hypothetical protein